VIDAIVWNAEDTRYTLDERLSSRLLSDHVQGSVSESALQGAIVVSRFDRLAASLIRETLDVSRIMAIQADVISGKLVPEY
jgi:hypothetical protein